MNMGIEIQASGDRVHGSTGLGKAVLLACCIGVTDSVCAFFIDHTLPVGYEIYNRRMLENLLPGTLVSGLLAFIIHVVLGILSWLMTHDRLGRRAPIHRLGRRLVHPFATVLSFLALRVALGEPGDNAVVIFAVAYGLLLAAALLLPSISSSVLPLLLISGTLVAVVLNCYFSATVIRSRLPAEVWMTACIKAAVIPMLVALVAMLPAMKRLRNATKLGMVLSASGAWLFGVAVYQVPESRNTAHATGPDVLLLVADTLRYDNAVGEKSNMPSVASLADRGMTYTNVRTPFPRTHPSMAAMHTGINPWVTGVQSMYVPLNSKFTTMAERFSAAGYDTVAFVHNPWIGIGMGHEQGFHEYIDASMIESILPQFHRLLPVVAYDRLLGAKRKKHANVDGAKMVELVRRRLIIQGSRPLFVWVQLFDPHWPYLPPVDKHSGERADYRRAHVVNHPEVRRIKRPEMIFNMAATDIRPDEVEAAKRLYNSESSYTDEHVAAIMDAFEPRGGMTIFTSDHGESLGEHDYFFHHGDYLYEPCLHVPLIISWEGKVPEGLVNDTPLSTVDILPSIASMLDWEPRGRLDGVPLPLEPGSLTHDRVIPFISDRPAKKRRIFMLRDRMGKRGKRGRGVVDRWRGVLLGDTKFMVQPRGKKQQIELYKLSDDPGELNNLYEDGMDISIYVEAMSSQGLTMNVQSDKAAQKARSSLGGEELERLEALGYIQ